MDGQFGLWWTSIDGSNIRNGKQKRNHGIPRIRPRVSCLPLFIGALPLRVQLDGRAGKAQHYHDKVEEPRVPPAATVDARHGPNGVAEVDDDAEGVLCGWISYET
jgi:hypothetical protein